MEEGEVVVGFSVSAGRDPSFRFQPGVGAFDGEAVVCLRVGGFESPLLATPDLAGWRSGGDWLAGAAWFADSWLDLTLAQLLLERA